ncbi:hypothetical protein AXF42_Ash010193 [Apostasia shenzhenica]|uniref:Uncharacterized protein n=1 Tax=Apostasia shenzhenica TaxID=1088818 RepID=A0A2I0A9S6_9ASPA|nr:hypothetical protein AXF42_Ash010193 [Apostasia shenzhenica]
MLGHRRAAFTRASSSNIGIFERSTATELCNSQQLLPPVSSFFEASREHRGCSCISSGGTAFSEHRECASELC